MEGIACSFYLKRKVCLALRQKVNECRTGGESEIWFRVLFENFSLYECVPKGQLELSIFINFRKNSERKIVLLYRKIHGGPFRTAHHLLLLPLLQAQFVFCQPHPESIWQCLDNFLFLYSSLIPILSLFASGVIGKFYLKPKLVVCLIPRTLELEMWSDTHPPVRISTSSASKKPRIILDYHWSTRHI